MTLDDNPGNVNQYLSQIRKCRQNEVAMLEIGQNTTADVHEIAVNAHFIGVLKGYGHFQDDDFVILPNSASSIKVSRYAASRQDAVIYRESTLKSASALVTVAALTQLSKEEGGSGEEEDKEEDEDSGEDSVSARGSAFEFKLNIQQFRSTSSKHVQIRRRLDIPGCNTW